MITDSE